MPNHPDPTFLITIPTDRVTQAAQALREMGIDFDPTSQITLIDPDRQLILHGAEETSTVHPPINSGDQIHSLIEGLNSHLEHKGLSPVLPEYSTDWPIAQHQELLHLATMEVLWDGDRPVVTDCFPRTQYCWERFVQNYPLLFPQQEA